MEWQPEQQDLGDLGFAGICREIYRVSLRTTIHPRLTGILSALLLANIAATSALQSRIDADDGSNLVRLIAEWVSLSISETIFQFALLVLSLTCTAGYVVCVATLYCTDGDSGASSRVMRNLPRAPLTRLVIMFIPVVALAILYISLSALAWVELPQPSDEVAVLALQLLGGAAFLAGASYFAVMSHISCVVAMLEDAFEDDVIFGAVCKSRELLAGRFWAAAAIFVPLDGCFVALQISFLELVLNDALGLGLGFQVAVGAAMAVALWAVVVLTLVAQPVVYLVCKNHHHGSTRSSTRSTSTMSESISSSPSTATAAWSCRQCRSLKLRSAQLTSLRPVVLYLVVPRADHYFYLA